MLRGNGYFHQKEKVISTCQNNKTRVDLEFWRNPEFEVYFFTISMELKKPYFKAFLSLVQYLKIEI